MKYIPILFSTPMVSAIIEGRKTMTRRVMKKQPTDNYKLLGYDEDGCMGEGKVGYCCFESENDILNIKCPYGKVGDVPWVRETFYEDAWGNFYYKADAEQTVKWKPSLFMPKAACRIFLEITDIRVERLQDIKIEDIRAEGIAPQIVEHRELWTKHFGDTPAVNFWESESFFGDYQKKIEAAEKEAFGTLWKSINGEDSWNQNPWVWVVSFKRIEKPTDFC